MEGESTENSDKSGLPVNSQGRYCVLEYRPEPWKTSAEAFVPIFMLVLDGRTDLHLFLNPNWRSFVQAEDLEYIELFIEDVRQRAQQFPKQLFDQLSSLALGPLVTLAAGPDFSERRDHQELCSQLEPI
jgi:hypothetical protein